MALEILPGFIRHHRYNRAPIRRVRCHCGAIYARTGSASDIRRAAGCSTCAQAKRKKYANAKERKRAENQRYWAKRKAREATDASR